LKIQDLLSKVDVATLCLIALCARTVTVGASIGDSIAILSICGLVGYVKFLNKQDKTWMKNILEEISSLKNFMTSLKMSQEVKKVHEKPQNRSQRNW
jgi:hypothetical protein